MLWAGMAQLMVVINVSVLFEIVTVTHGSQERNITIIKMSPLAKYFVSLVARLLIRKWANKACTGCEYTRLMPIR